MSHARWKTSRLDNTAIIDHRSSIITTFATREDREKERRPKHCKCRQDSSIHSNMESEKDEEGSPWKGRQSVKDPQARRWMSSTAASLLDNHDEEEEDGLEEPDLLSVSIESATDSSEKFNAQNVAPGLSAIDQSNPESATVSSVVRLTEGMLTEGMTGMLCSVPLNGNHRRIDSETEVLQKDLSVGHCGTAPFCMPSKETPPPFSTREMGKSVNESLTMLDRIDTLNDLSDSVVDESESTLGRSDTLKKTEPMSCADVNLIDLQKLVATDIIDVLGSSTGVASDWFATLGAWLVPSSHEAQQRPRRVFRNRCSVRKAQSHRLKELWYKWHSNGSEDSGSRLGSDLSGSNNPMKPNPNMPPFRLWSLAVTKSLDDAELVAPLTSVPGIPLSQSSENTAIAPPVKEVKLFSSKTSKQRAPTPPVDLYYDSDPEIFRVTRRSPAAASNKDDYMGKKPLRWRRRVSIPMPINTSLSVDNKEIVRPLTPKHVKGKGAPSFDIGSFDSDVDDRFDLLDDSLVKEFIKVSRK